MAKLSDLKKLMDAATARPVALAAPAKRSDPATSTNISPSRAAFAARPPPISARRAAGAAKHADGDVDIARIFADVEKMPRSNRAQLPPRHPPPIPRHTLADERDVLQAAKYGDDPAPQTWDVGQEFEHEQTFVRKGIGPDVATKLRRGYWSVQGELDLHGYTTDEAHDALSDFIVNARTRGARCVRVIHGKGLTSLHKEPILKGKVRRWLAHWDEVLAYVEAPQHAGGGGAMLVLLKGS